MRRTKTTACQLHVRHVPGGRFSEGVLGRIAKGDRLRIELPFGEFTLREGSDRPALLLATGTGFAPVKSIVEDAIKRRLERPLHLYWGARRAEDLYLAALAQKWHDSGRAKFVPVLSEADEAWTGRRGFVHEAVLEDFGSLAGYEAYACGNPSMTSVAARHLREGRLASRRLLQRRVRTYPADAPVSLSVPPALTFLQYKQGDENGALVAPAKWLRQQSQRASSPSNWRGKKIASASRGCSRHR